MLSCGLRSGSVDSDSVLKWLAWAVSAILALLVAGIALLLLSDRVFFAAVARLAPALTPYQVTLDNPQMHWRESRLEIDTLQVHQAGSDGAPILGIDGLSISGEPRELFKLGISRADVSAGAVLLYVDETDSNADPNPAEWLQYTTLFPRRLSIGTLHIVARDTDVNVFPFSNLYGGWQDDSHFVASAGADVTGMPLVLALSVERKALSANNSQLAIAGALKPQQGSSRIELDGQLTATDETVTYRFDLHAEYERVQDFLNAIEEGAYPFAGKLILDGTLVGGLQQYDLEVQQLALDNGEAYEFMASGSVNKSIDSPAQLAVSARGRMASVDQLLDLTDIDLGQIGEASARLQLTGPLTDPVLEDFTLRTWNDAGLALSVTPRTGTFRLQQRALLPGQELALALSAPRLAAISPWVGDLLFEPGAWSLQTLLSQNDNAFRLSELGLTLGDSAALQASLEGSIGALRFGGGQMPEIDGIDITLEGNSKDVQQLLSGLAVELPELPAVRTAEISAHLRGSWRDLFIETGHIAATGDELVLDADKLSARLQPNSPQLLASASGSIDLTLVSAGPLALLDLPAQVDLLQALQVYGQASYDGKKLALSDFTANAQALDGTLRVRGSIGDVLHSDALSLDVSVQAVPLARLAAAAQTGQPSPATASIPGLLSGSAHVSGKPGSLAVESIDLALLGDPAAGATLQGRASLKDGVPSAQIEAAYRLDNRQLIETLSGQSLAPGSGTLVLDYQAQRVVAVLHSLMGDSDISMVLDATRDPAGITGLEVDLNIPRLYLPDVLGAPRAAALQEGRSSREATNGATELLAWRESLPAYPLRLEANIDEIVGDNTALDGFTFRISGADRRYILENFDISYAGGSAIFRGVADLAGEKPGISVAGSAEAVPVTALAADLGYAGDIEGTVSMLTGLTAQGGSVDDMIRSLSGRAAVAIADGHIEGAAYDLLATDLLGWLLSGGLLEDATDFSCAAVNFNLNEGRATSDRLYVLTDNMVASGNATVDLAARELDIRVQPRARRRSVQMPSSISVRGPLDAPRVRISPVAATMDTTAKILFFVPDLLLRLFGLGPDAQSRVQECTVDG